MTEKKDFYCNTSGVIKLPPSIAKNMLNSYGYYITPSHWSDEEISKLTWESHGGDDEK